MLQQYSHSQYRNVCIKTIYNLVRPSCCVKTSLKHKIDQREFEIPGPNNGLLDVIPEAFLRVRVDAGLGIHKLVGVVDGSVGVALCCKRVVSSPFVCVDDGARKDPAADKGEENLCSTSVRWARKEEALSGIPIDPSENPHTFSVCSFIELPFPKLGLVHLHDDSRTAERTKVCEEPVSKSSVQIDLPV